MLPTIVADRMCYGKLLIEPQSYPIGSFENKPTNDAFPSGLYGSILVAVLCSSDKDEAETQIELHQDTIDFENKLSSEDTTNALISLGLAFLFLESSTIDFVRATNIVRLFCIKTLGEANSQNDSINCTIAIRKDIY